MKALEEAKKSWTICSDCQGQGQKSRKVSRRAKLLYQEALTAYEASGSLEEPPLRPQPLYYTCASCSGTGLQLTENKVNPIQPYYPHLAIVGAGIAGVALAIACQQRGIPYTLYERDLDFTARASGYGLTLQQANKAIAALGISDLKEGLISTKHIVHTATGEVVGEWGLRKWLPEKEKQSPKKSNIHIARQALRQALLTQLGGLDKLQWGHQLIQYTSTQEGKIQLQFEVAGEVKEIEADLLVAADGIRSTVRKLAIGETESPLQYLGCMVILGICPLASLEALNSPLLDNETVFQSANGHERMYMMPYRSDEIMWQLSFPIAEAEAQALREAGPEELKKVACTRANWHVPIPQILAATASSAISGYPVYDRALLSPEQLAPLTAITLIGDAAHPMSPFKGQGANQAILDALALARLIAKTCASAHWRAAGLRAHVLNTFETEMLNRTAVKVKDSAAAAQFLHSEIALQVGDKPRGSCIKKQQK